jgi:cholesterol transport system auxiliary component
MRKFLLVYGVLLTGLIAACSFEPRDTGSGFMFALEPVEAAAPPAADKTLVDKVLVIAQPTAIAELDTYRIALKKGAQRWDYYAGARWSDFLPAVVQDDLTKTLEQSGLFKNVTADESGLTGDRILKVEIKKFQAEYAEGAAPVIRIRLAVNLISRLERARLASFTISAEKAASGNTLSSIQAAFAAAFSDAERQAVTKLAETGK